MFEAFQFEPEDAMILVNQPMNLNIRSWFTMDYAKRLRQHTISYTGMVNQEIMVCFGLMRLWGKRAYLWSVFGESTAQHAVSVYRGLKRMLDEQELFDRIEMDVPTDMPLAHRRAKYLGFDLECQTARKYSPLGEDRSIYVWVRK